MSNQKNLKPYVVTLTVKPKPQGIYKYSSRSYRGIAMATSPNNAKEQAIQVLLISFKDNDGSSTKKPLIDRETIKIKGCILCNDFFTTSEKQTDGCNDQNQVN